MANFQSGLFNFCRSDIGRALVLSLALHALLLLQTVPGASSVGSLRGFTATGSVGDATLRGMIAAPAVTPAVVTRPPVAAVPALPGKPLPSASRRRDESVPDVASGHIGRSEAAAERFSAGREVLAIVGATAAAAPSDGEAVDAGGLRLYRLSLAIESRRFKRYPPEALEQRWSGTAQVSVAMAADGRPESVRLVTSSGHEALDAAALEMIHKAALNAMVPPSLRGRSFTVPLPVEFRRDPD